MVRAEVVQNNFGLAGIQYLGSAMINVACEICDPVRPQLFLALAVRAYTKAGVINISHLCILMAEMRAGLCKRILSGRGQT